MKVPKIKLAQTVVKLCEYKEIKHIVISPGSRNAPLTIGFSNHDFFTCYSIVDERSAAFFALGIAQQTQNPVALVCTSGSALLNYYPAIVEAFYSNIPLVVLSADRPKQYIGIGDGQTINQRGVYGSHILYEANLKDEIRDEQIYEEDEPKVLKSKENKQEKLLGLQESIESYNTKKINTALNTAISSKGPVHVNIPFDEPLYNLQENFSVEPKNLLLDSKPSEDYNYDYYKRIWQQSKRKMVLIGVNMPNQVEQIYLDKLAEDASVLVFTETTSNLHHENFFPNIDQIIAPLSDIELKDLQPDIVLTFGGLVVSKKIKAFLRNHKPEHHWHIGETTANDTFFVLDQHFKISINSFFKAFLEDNQSTKSDYFKTWNTVKQHRLQKHDLYVNEIPFSDFTVFETILKSIPDYTQIQSGNSSAIRYLQLFNLNKTLKVFCNRGTSGIDGSASTAIGAAIVSKEPTVLITGDLSFFYDSNALWNNYIPNSFRIILINNQGGGIFRILPGHKNSENFDTYFETKHNLNAKHLCAMYGIDYITASNNSQLNTCLDDFYVSSDKPKLLEVFTPRTLNDEVLLNYFKYIK
ncbi:MAG: 2-succinyl-5-enolpyruvyl-6-hydroxy-3-cyclohexene-1-carboxylate synthase [Bacteroidia bacterium]|nr:2-succinyl-5-enolpyruvyl-6-hydroxy-3-cyclohexene-1-carboxylate synthase [Bacteroidia bacterium]